MKTPYKQHAVYKNGKVTTPESFKKPYWTVQEIGTLVPATPIILIPKAAALPHGLHQ